jgi:hypothetical protein
VFAGRKFLYLFKLDSTGTKLIPYYKDYFKKGVHYKDEDSAIDLESNGSYLIDFLFLKSENKVIPVYMNETITARRKDKKAFCWWY